MMKRSLVNRSTGFEFNEESRSFSGYGIVFNSDSVAMTIFDQEAGEVNVYEQITRESLSAADTEDMISAINHDFTKILGRTSSNTLEFSIDDKGVFYRIPVLPDTTYANDLKESTSRGDYKGSSFTFSIDWEKGYDIEERQDGSLVAKPVRINKIYEMGPVTNPAYPATTAENRSDHLFSAAKEFLQRKKDAKETEKTGNITLEEMNDIEKRLRLEEVEI